MFERIRKWLALQSYEANLGRLLRGRYGRERHYTPPQVLATIKQHRLSERYAAYACAMFCSQRAYDEFVTASRTLDGVDISPMAQLHTVLWVDVAVHDWPAHSAVASELNDSHGSPQHWHFGSDHSGYSSHEHFGDAHFEDGGGSHDSGGHGGDSTD